MKPTAGHNGSISDAILAAKRRAKFNSFVKSKPVIACVAVAGLAAVAAAASTKPNA